MYIVSFQCLACSMAVIGSNPLDAVTNRVLGLVGLGIHVIELTVD